MYAVNLTEMWDKGITKGDSSWPTVDCRHGWEFNYTDIPYSTIASEVRSELGLDMTCVAPTVY